MAGVMMEGDEGMEVKRQSVPTIGGTDGVGSTAEVVASTHLNDTNAEGNQYSVVPQFNENQMKNGTDFGEANNPLRP